jgi:glucose-6-phosphate isomerase
METLKLTIDKVFECVSKEAIYGYKDELEKYNTALDDKTGKGSDFLGWVNLPSTISEAERPVCIFY